MMVSTEDEGGGDWDYPIMFLLWFFYHQEKMLKSEYYSFHFANQSWQEILIQMIIPELQISLVVFENSPFH